MTTSTTQGAPRRAAWGLWLLLAVFYAYFIAMDRGYQLDDALIYLRYIENALHGHGLVYNDGVRFNGLTSPLFSYLVLALAWIADDASFASFAVSGIALFLAAWMMARLFEPAIAASAIPLPQVFAWLGAALMLFLPYFYLTFGMETGLYTLLSAALIYLMRERSYGPAGLCAALVFLTRSEGALLIVAVAAVELLRRRRLPPFSFATYVAPPLIVACVLAFNSFYYGAPLPQSGMAKIWQGESGLWGEHLSYLQVGYLYDWIFAANPLVVTTYAAFAAIGLLVLRDGYLVWTTVAYLVLYGAFYLALNIPNYHWYYSPFFAFAPYFAAAGFGRVLAALRQAEPGRRGLAVMAVVGIPVAVTLASGFRLNGIARGGVEAYHRIGLWMKDRLPADAVVAMVEIGTVGYYSDRNIVDMLGLVNPDIAKFVGERRFDAWLKEYKVTDILVHDPLWDHEISLFGAALAWGLSENCDFNFPGYRLLHVDVSAGRGIHACDPSQAYLTDTNAMEMVDGEVDPGRGHVDGVRVVGNFLRIYGWARDEAGTPYGRLQFGHGGAFIWQRVPRHDVVTHFSASGLEFSGFSGVIRFDTYEQARAAAQTGCLMTAGESGKRPALLPFHDGETCR